MPNLKYDPQDPSDLLGRPLAVGDVIAWGHTLGRSPAMTVGRIEHIRYTREIKLPTYGTKRVECPQSQAERYTFRVKPIKSTGTAGYSRSDGEKLRTIIMVKNVVKLEPLDG